MIACGVAPLAALAATRPAEKAELLSRGTGANGKAGDAPSGAPAVSKDGRFVAFSSAAGNFSDRDSSARDVFVRDLRGDRTELVSARNGRDGRGGRGESARPSISADGRFVAFQSKAPSLADAADDEAALDVFVRDRKLRVTLLASRASGEQGLAADFDSGSPSISADGRLVAFDSIAENLSPADDARYRDIFVRDLREGSTRLVDRSPGSPGRSGDGNAERPSISANGSRVAFESDANNLSELDDDKVRNVFVRDLDRDETILVSRAPGDDGKGGDGPSSHAAISADGRYVAYVSAAKNLSKADDDRVRDVFVRDLEKNETVLVSRASGKNGAAGNLSSAAPTISGDGRFVAFESLANDLSDADDDSGTARNVYVRDLVDARTQWVSRAKGRGKRRADLSSPSIAANGALVAFASDADNLSGDDRDPAADVFSFPVRSNGD